jgi:ABC-2 type transport system permease protein
VTRLVRAELLKLRTTRLLLWLGLLVLALEVLVIALHVGQDSLGSLDEPRSQRDIVAIAAISALISLILGIVSSAGEFVHGTINQTFLVAPVRERVVSAKLVAAAIAGATLGLAACVFAWAFAALLLVSRSVPIHLFSGSVLRVGLGTILAAALTGAFGIGYGALVPGQTAAIVTALIWLLVGEPLLGIADVQQYAPGHAIASVVEAGTQGSNVLRFGPGLALAIAYAVVAGVAGAVVLRRTDVT